MNTLEICIWDFDGAPGEYKMLSRHGGDEEYIIFVPRACVIQDTAAYFFFLQAMEREWHSKDFHIVPGGFIVILAH